MYNHNKAQQSKTRVYISWDILYVAHFDELMQEMRKFRALAMGLLFPAMTHRFHVEMLFNRSLMDRLNNFSSPLSCQIEMIKCFLQMMKRTMIYRDAVWAIYRGQTGTHVQK